MVKLDLHCEVVEVDQFLLFLFLHPQQQFRRVIIFPCHHLTRHHSFDHSYLLMNHYLSFHPWELFPFHLPIMINQKKMHEFCFNDIGCHGGK
jgi:hypothetical protein